MFCPKCKMEYQDGYLECSDCQVELVSALDPEPVYEPTYVDYEAVASVVDIGMVAIIKSLLEEEKITYFIRGDETIHLYPGVPAQIMVRKDQAEQAQEILKDMLAAASEME